MSLWRQLSRGLRALLRRPVTDQETTDEVQHYWEEAVAGYMARGLSPAAARRAARLELGSVTNVEEQIRVYGWENVIDRAFMDLRYAARRLRAAPGFTMIATLTLALGIGATTAIFSAVNSILLRPLPYPQADRIGMIWDLGADGARLDVTFGTYRELAARSRSFDTLAILRPWQATVTGGAEPERLQGQRVSAGYLDVLGVIPVLGRGFRESDDLAGAPNVIILSDALWRRRFGSDASILGRPVSLDGIPFTVIGVMPADYENVTAPSAELWTTLQYDMSQGRAWGHHLRMIGRLRPGVAIDQARAELNTIASHVLPEFPRPEWAAVRQGLILESLHEEVTRAVRPALLIILGAVLLVLMIACVNVTNLLLARGLQRRGELAVRAALGAGRSRLIRQMLTESLMLAALGGAIGMVMALVGARALAALGTPGLASAGGVTFDGGAFAFGLALTTVAGVGFGLMPAWQAARSDPRQGLEQNSRRTTVGHGRARNALVVIEISLALVLLVSSALLLRSLGRLFAVDAGFDSARLLTLQVQAAGPRFGQDSTTWRFFAQALEAVRRVPGVAAAALTSQLPLSGDYDLWGVHFDPPRASDPGEVRGTYRYAVSPGFLETMRIPVRHGRRLGETDDASSPRVALISESLAKRRLPGSDPVGQRVYIGPQEGPPFTIVGVVADVKQLSLSLNESEAVYVPAAQWHFADAAMSMVVRAHGDAAALASAVRQAIWSVDRDQAIVRVATMDDLLAASAAERRFALILFQAFALAALVLAAAGIYGVISGGVAERTREIGVRSALGASRLDIVLLVMRHGMMLAGIGVAIGIAGAVAATQALVTLLFDVSRLDPVAYLGVIALLAFVALAACSVPAWRAARVDPARTLRAD